jgi:hypothetical protein
MADKGDAQKGSSRLGRTEVILSIVASLIAIAGTTYGIWVARSSPPSEIPAPAPVAQSPLEDTFVLSPVWWGQDLTVTVRKARTGYKGNIVVFYCNTASGHYGWVGEAAFGTATEDFVVGGEYENPTIVLGINVNPEDGDTKTLVSTWELKKLRQVKPPKVLPGSPQCHDLVEER